MRELSKRTPKIVHCRQGSLHAVLILEGGQLVSRFGPWPILLDRGWRALETIYVPPIVLFCVFAVGLSHPIVVIQPFSCSPCREQPAIANFILQKGGLHQGLFRVSWWRSVTRTSPQMGGGPDVSYFERGLRRSDHIEV